MDNVKHIPIIIITTLFLIFLIWGMHIDGEMKGQSKICKQVCPTDIWRIKDDVCECVIETVVSPRKIILIDNEIEI